MYSQQLVPIYSIAKLLHKLGNSRSSDYTRPADTHIYGKDSRKLRSLYINTSSASVCCTVPKSRYVCRLYVVALMDTDSLPVNIEAILIIRTNL